MSPALLALFPFAAAVAAGAVPLLFGGGERLRPVLQHLAAGVVTAAVAVELIPDLLRQKHPAAAAAGFCLAVGLLIVLGRFEDAEDGPGRLPWTYLAAVGTDLFLDGFVLALGASLGARQGKLLALALALEMASGGMATASMLSEATGKGRSFTINAAVSALLLVGAGVGMLTVHHLPRAGLAAALGFGAAALLYLVTEELLRESHAERRDTSIVTATYFAGFLFLLLLDMAGA